MNGTQKMNLLTGDHLAFHLEPAAASSASMTDQIITKDIIISLSCSLHIILINISMCQQDNTIKSAVEHDTDTALCISWWHF